MGTVTKPGLAIPPGEPAINPVPRRMIREAVREVTPRGVRVTISIPGGGELARKTFNPRIGIVGGLSILGTTGIVRPFSCSALRESLRCALNVAAAAGIRAPVLVPGHIGERAARAHFRVADEQVVEVGNEWGFVLDEAAPASLFGPPDRGPSGKAGEADGGRLGHPLRKVGKRAARRRGNACRSSRPARGAGHNGRGALRGPRREGEKDAGGRPGGGDPKGGRQTDGGAFRRRPWSSSTSAAASLGASGDLKPWL